ARVVEVAALGERDEAGDGLRGALAVELEDDVGLGLARAGVQRDGPGAVLGDRGVGELVVVPRLLDTRRAGAGSRGVVGRGAVAVHQGRDDEGTDEREYCEQRDQGPETLLAGALGCLPLCLLLRLPGLLR